MIRVSYAHTSQADYLKTREEALAVLAQIFTSGFFVDGDLVWRDEESPGLAALKNTS